MSRLIEESCMDRAIDAATRKAVSEFVERVKACVEAWCRDTINEDGENSDSWHELEPHGWSVEDALTRVPRRWKDEND